MRSFIDFIAEGKAKGGLYVSLLPSPESRDAIFDFCQKNNIPNLVAKDELHSTVVYSRSHVENQSIKEFKMPVSATVNGWEVLPSKDDGSVLTMKLKSSDMRKVNAAFRDRGATSDYPTYKPHITVALDWKGSPPTVKPSLSLSFGTFEVKPLDLDYKPKKA